MRHHPDAVMIFAAGHGTRMRPLTLTRPKALVRVAGRALIDHALAQADAVAPARIVVNAHAHADALADHLASRPEVRVLRENRLLETGGGLRAAGPALGEGPVMALNADAVWSGPSAFATLAGAWDPQRMGALLLLVPPDRAKGHAGSGDFALGPDGRLGRPGPLIYTGAQILDPEGLADCPDEVFSIRWLWQRLGEAGRLFGCLYPGHWADVGTPEGIVAAEAMLEHG